MNQPLDFLGRGWAFPIGVETETGRMKLVEYAEDVKQSIRIILGTSKGERVMRPEFGCGIHDLPFETMDATTIGFVKSSVEEALTEYEPRINLKDVRVSEEKTNDGILEVTIEYYLRQANRRDNLVYNFYLRERS